MNDIRLTRETGLSLVNLGAVYVSLADEVEVSRRVIRRYLIEDVIKPDHKLSVA
jgi:hypothetical protein